MKLSARDAARFFRDPDPDCAGLLIHGEDAMRVAMRRAEVVSAMVGPEAEAEMRLSRISGADLRRDPALLSDALKARGFFEGPRAVILDDATDGVTKPIAAALSDWQGGDAQLVATSGLLPARSSLRKLFEAGPNLQSAALYNDPPGRAEIEAEIARSGLAAPHPEGMAALEALARELTPGDLRQTIEKIALYKIGDGAALSAEDVTLMAPASLEAGIDDVLDVLASGRTGEIAPVMARLAAQGVTPVTLIISAARHFRQLYAVVSAPGAPSQAVARLRPPVFGPRRDRMIRQSGRWTADRLEEALTLLMETDLTLRSAGAQAPARALVERAFVRLAYMARA